MAGVLGCRSFGNRETAADRLIVVSGTPTYETTNLPPASFSGTTIGAANASFRAPWYDDANATLFEPSTDELWFHARYYFTLNNTTNDSLILGVGDSGTEMFAISMQDNTALITIRVAGVVRATAAAGALSINTWHRIHVHVQGQLTGDVISVYTAGNLTTPVVTYTLIAADQTNLSGLAANEFRVVANSAGSPRFDDLIAWDPQDADFEGIQFYASASIAEQLVNGDGAHTDWTGAYTAIDERPPNDADKITASAVGNVSTFTKAAIASDNVWYTQITARVTRTGTDAGANMSIRIDDGTNQADVTMAAPGDGYVTAPFQLDPAGLPWSPTQYDATDVGVVSVT